MDTLAKGLGNGVSIALATLLFAALFQFIRISLKQGRECAQEVGEVKADCQWKEQQNSELITACQKGGIEIPPIVWQRRPPTPTKRQRREGTDAR